MYPTKREKDRFLRAMIATVEMLKGQVSDTAMTAWEHHLSTYPVDIVEEACHEAQRRLTYFPVPHELLDICDEIVRIRQARHLRATTNIDALLPPADPALRALTEPVSLSKEESVKTLKLLQGRVTLAVDPAMPHNVVEFHSGGSMTRLVGPPEPDPVQHRKRVLEQARQLREEADGGA